MSVFGLQEAETQFNLTETQREFSKVILKFKW